jgi:hypothetical protein
MRKLLAVCSGTLVAIACAGSVLAHHSGYVYQTTPIWINGSVTRFELKNPHTITTVEARTEDGQARLWAVEGPPQTALDRRGGSGAYVPKVGDAIAICAFPYRPAEEIARDSRIVGSFDVSALSSRTADGASPRFVAGHVLVTSDGAMHLWEPHGFISECIRSSHDPRESWAEFLNANAQARASFCGQRRNAHVQSDASLKELVEEVGRALDDPCD